MAEDEKTEVGGADFEAALDAAMDGMGLEEGAVEAPVEPQEAPEPEGEPEDPEPENVEEAAPGEPETAKASQGLDLADDETYRAYHALRRDGIPDRVIQAMTSDELLQLGATRLKVQKDTDAAFSELGKLRSAKETPGEPDREPAREAESPLLEGFSKAVGPIAEELGLGDAASAKLGRGFQEAVMGVLGPELEMVKTERAAMMDFVIDSARQGLGERFPQLLEDEGFTPVRDRLFELLPSKVVSPELRGAARVQALLERAARDVGLEEASESNRKQPGRRGKGETPTRPRRASGGRKTPQSWETSVDDYLERNVK
jgi:hypothetical protein